MDWANALRTDLRARAELILSANASCGYQSRGTKPTVLFVATGDGSEHANFHPSAWQAIRASDTWKQRLEKSHSQKDALPPDRSETARELDSSNSSDALLMNVFCVPDSASTAARVLGASPQSSIPVFGWKPGIELVDGTLDDTEVDMRLGDTIVEAKLTERDFTRREDERVRRYRELQNVFEVGSLRARDGFFDSYQLIRNVLAAAQHGLRLVVIIDARRPDLLHEWWHVHSAIRDATLRARCGFRFWQELAVAVPAEHGLFLRTKYGI